MSPKSPLFLVPEETLAEENARGVDWAAIAGELRRLARGTCREDLLAAALDILTTTCGAAAAAIWTYEAVGGSLRPAADRGLSRGGQAGQRDWTDLLKLPLHAGGRLVGVLEAYASGEHEFTAEQRAAAEMVAATLACGLHVADLAERLAAAERERAALERTDDLDTIARMWRAGHALTYPALFTAVLDGLGDALAYDAAALLLGGETEPEFLPVLRAAAGPQHLADLRGRAAAALAELTGDHPEPETSEPVTASFRSGFAVALVDQGQSIGVIYLAALAPDAFTESQIRLVRVLAEHAVDSMRHLNEMLTVEAERLQTIIESLPQGVVLLGAAGEVLLSNRPGRVQLGLLCPEGGPITELGGRALGELTAEALASGIDLARHEYELRRADRTYNLEVTLVPVRERSELVGTVLSIRDVSGERQAEQRLYHDARLASIGALAAGLAHELNNPLMITLGLAEVLEEDAATVEAHRELLREIREASLRAADVVRQLMTFADSQQQTGWDTLYLPEVIDQAVGMVASPYARDGVQVTTAYAADLPPVEGNAGKLQQVVLNLLSNSYEAILHSGVGRQVEVRVEAVDGEVWVEVDDDGPGVPDELQSTIFDVFFTTKRDYHGKGLGLSIAHRVALEHHASLGLAPSRLGGACFRLALPAQRWESPDEENRLSSH